MSRPATFEEFIGQADAVLQLKTLAAAALLRGEAPDHLLLTGPPGLGKTTLAHLLAGAVGVELLVSSGPALRSVSELVAVLTALPPGGLLFIDEVHRMPVNVEEVFYGALEDFKLTLGVGKTGERRSLPLPLPRFCCIGATTQLGLLTAPLRSRFGVTVELSYYGTEELGEIIRREAQRLELELSTEAQEELARSARGTPRLALNLTQRLRDFCLVRGGIVADLTAARAALRQQGITRLGLNRVDRTLLSVVRDVYRGGPVGISALASTLAVTPGTLAEVHEPHLLACGLLARTQRGRMLTDAGRAYLRELGTC